MENPRDWIQCNETAKSFLARLAVERPALLLPPLHRVPLRTGNVVEITGPSPSAKSEILLQAAISCILPKEWNGIRFGGLERSVMYFDLDCRFDILRLAQCLKHRFVQSQDIRQGLSCGSENSDTALAETNCFDKELVESCMKRFLYTRCYSSHEFLSALKTSNHQLQKEKEATGIGVHFLMIDSIGAFYWMDRSHQPSPYGDGNRKSMCLQSIMGIVAQEINKLLQIQPMLVLATKATIFGLETSAYSGQRSFGGWPSDDASSTKISNRDVKKCLYREYMPSTWQLFATHRVFLGLSDEKLGGAENANIPIYTSEWVLPSLHHCDRFIIRDDGIVMIP